MNHHIQELKIGVLLPKSSLYPSIGFDIKDGLQARLSLEETSYKLIFENIGNGGVDALVYEKAEKLLMTEDVVAVVAYLDHTAAAKLDKLFAQSKRLLIVLDPGAHTPVDWKDKSPYRLTLSLQTALNNNITGALAAKNGASKTFFSTSFYEGGYLQSNTYLKGFEKAGGSILYHAVVPFRINEFNAAQLRQAADYYQPDTVLAQFSAEAGAFFLERYIESGLSETARLYASPFMLEESWISTLTYPFDGISGSVSWFSKIDNNENNFFVRTIKENYDKDATLFSLLGWEAALLIIQLSTAITEANHNVNKAMTTFSPIEIDSPRGTLFLHDSSNVFFGPAYLVEMVEHEATGKCELEFKEELSYDIERFVNEIPEGVFSKWTNTYLCI